jgi:pimeloyl-ACP methyl ester carboxylesterase
MGLLPASATGADVPKPTDIIVTGQVAAEVQKRTGLLGPVLRIYDYFSNVSWIPTSMKALEEAERRLFTGVKSYIRTRFVPVWSGRYQVWTVAINSPPSSSLQNYQLSQQQLASINNTASEKIPLVLIHGFAGGVALWAQNLDELAKDRTVYAFDLLGFARSSRPKFSHDPTLAETEWVRSIEEWRHEMRLEKMIVLGHSLGGYLASAYALQHPERVRHLILVEPWGFLPKPSNTDRQYSLPVWVRTLAHIASIFNPLTTLRVAGPWGPTLVRRVRGDLGRKFGNGGNEEAIFDYIYHCNAQEPSGESAFKTLSASFGWAKRPMIDRLPSLKKDVPITFIYGSRSWMDAGPGYEMQQNLRPDAYVNVQVVSGAGHHVYADEAERFNSLTTDVCRLVDNDADENEDQNDI